MAIPHKEHLATLHAICLQISVIFHKNAREYIQYSLRFLFHLTKNLMTHLSHNLCAVLPYRKTHQKWCVFCCSAEFVKSLQKKLTKQYGYDTI